MLPAMPKDPEHEQSESDSIPDDDDTEETRDSTDAEEPVREAKPRRRKEASDPPRRKRRKVKKPIPKTEAEIDSPKPLTLLLLGVMSASTLIMWGSARFACNERGEVVKAPPQLPTVELARNPKDAAIEMQHRAATYNFKGALELTKGSAAEELAKAKQQACASDEACAKKQEEVGDKVLTTGALLTQDEVSATVRVSTTAPSGSSSYLLRLEPEGRIWKVTERRPDKAAKN